MHQGQSLFQEPLMSEAVTASAAGRVGAFLQRAGRYANYALEAVAPVLPKLLPAAERRQQTEIDGFVVRCQRTLPTDPTVVAAWESLYARTSSATPFQSPAWQRALLQNPQALRRLRFFTIYQNEKLIGVLPLESRGGILRSSGAMLSDYLDPLIDPQFADACWPAALKAIRKLAPGRSLMLENVRDESCGGISNYALSAGFALGEPVDSSVARIALPKTWDEYLATLDKHEKKELKRKINKAETQGGAKLEVCNDPNTIVAEITAMFELINGANTGKSRKAKWVFPRHFALSAPAMAASGKLVLYKLIIENKHAAGLIALPTHRGQILWNTTFDPAMKQWSPGIVMFGMLIRRSIEQGHEVFDLLRGQYDYKYRLGAADHPLRTITLRPAA
jgi:CelD/BcsL family acetyltransferase involved in cellulose biosynthesis